MNYNSDLGKNCEVQHNESGYYNGPYQQFVHFHKLIWENWLIKMPITNFIYNFQF